MKAARAHRSASADVTADSLAADVARLNGNGPPLLGTAAEHATRRVPVAKPDDLATDVREGLIGHEFDSIEDIAVIESGRVVGLVPAERLLAADADAQIADVMDADPPVIGPHTDHEHAAHHMAEHHEASLPVVDTDGRFLGLIPPYRMLGVLLSEHDEDLARLGGYLAGTERARGAAQESIKRRLWHRLPWLLLGLLGAMLSAVLVGAFEARLEANVLIAFFIPAIVYMADAVGTQTEAVLIRGLSAGVSARSILRRELLTGAIMGIVVGLAFLAFASFGWGDERVALAVGVALFASCSLATGIAVGFPALFQRLGRDPAFGSGPLATVAQDLLSIAVYLAVVTVLVP